MPAVGCIERYDDRDEAVEVCLSTCADLSDEGQLQLRLAVLAIRPPEKARCLLPYPYFGTVSVASQRVFSLYKYLISGVGKNFHSK